MDIEIIALQLEYAGGMLRTTTIYMYDMSQYHKLIFNFVIVSYTP